PYDNRNLRICPAPPLINYLLAMEITGHDMRGSWRIYRGHYDGRWQLLPSYFRSVPPRADHLAATVRQGQLAYLKKKHQRVDFDSLTPLQQDAVIQHCLLPRLTGRSPAESRHR
ncbi:MAG: hypothetical protein AAB225_12450, partial [Acidobacteriota bacterium]